MDAVVRFILPVKALALGKSRLDLPAEQRTRLLEAMLIDTITATLESDLGPVVVVSPDPRALEVARTHGASGLVHGGRLNQAIAFAVQDERRHAALLPDLPALDPQELRAALAFAPAGFVADHCGLGTTMLFGVWLSPKFGPKSARRHEDAGYTRVDLPLPGLSHDVDILEDLYAVEALGVGSRTKALLAELGRVH
jgi:2-phospho-L-lactate guanylyltransferase